jgi:hypothetical protein
MKYQLSKLACALIVLCACSQVHAQQQAQLKCQGVMGDVPAVLSGLWQFTPYNAMQDGYVKFAGEVSAGGISARMTYEGYTRSAPYGGVITNSQGALRVGVLDNTGGQMLIYEGTPRLGPPTMIGRFVCDWQ